MTGVKEIQAYTGNAKMLENIARYNDMEVYELVELMCEFIDQVCKHYELIQCQFQYDMRKGGQR